MNSIQKLRHKLGLSQQSLAVLAQTSQPTIAAYESGAKSPNLSTLERIAHAVGLEPFIVFVPSFTREDRRSLFYHQEIVKLLLEDHEQAVKRARKNLKKMKSMHSDAQKLFQLWKTWLEAPLEELINRILDPGLLARDMRQVSPFAGLLSAKDRVRVLKEFKKTYETS